MSSRVRVKICGITNLADAEAAIAAGADALGFNLFPGSKRFVPLAELRGWLPALPPMVQRWAVLVNPAPALVSEAGELLDVLQFHGDEAAADASAMAAGRAWVKGMGLKERADFSRVDDFAKARAMAVLVDAFVPGEFGGTGRLINLDLAAELVAERPEVRVILSGGLRPENVAEAVRKVQPDAVDVASGVERSGDPRRKDAGRMREFMAAVRAGSAV